jgi:hypothetical protein
MATNKLRSSYRIPGARATGTSMGKASYTTMRKEFMSSFGSPSQLSIAFALVLIRTAHAQGYTCKSRDFFSDMMIRQISSSIADTTSRRASGLPNVPSSQVTLATDPTVCNRAMLAVDTLAHSQHPAEPMPPQGTGSFYVLKIGSYTGVALPDSAPAGRIRTYAPLFLFDSVWHFVSIIGL